MTSLSLGPSFTTMTSMLRQLCDDADIPTRLHSCARLYVAIATLTKPSIWFYVCLATLTNLLVPRRSKAPS